MAGRLLDYAGPVLRAACESAGASRNPRARAENTDPGAGIMSPLL